MRAAEAVDVKEVEAKVAELSRLTGVQLRLEKSKHLEMWHIHSFEKDQWMAFITRERLGEILYWMNVMIAFEEIRRYAKA